MRFERFFTELRDPLFALYGDDPRFGAAWERLLAAVAATAAARSRELRVLDHEREITPGLAPARAGGRLRDLRRPLRRDAGRRAREAAVPARAGRDVPAPDAAAARAAGAQRRRLRGRRLRRGRAGAGDDGRPARAGVRPARGRDGAVRRPRAQPHRGRAPVGGAHPDLLSDVPGPPEPDAYERTLPDVFPDTAPGQLHVGRGAAGSGRRSTPTSGTSTTRTPTCSWRWRRRCSTWPRSGVDVLRLDAAPFLWKRVGTNCQNQPEVHELLQAFRAAMRIAAPAVAFKAEAIVAPRDLVPYLGTGATRARSATSPTTTCSMVLLWSALASGPGGADDQHAEGDAAGPAGRRLADLRALPRRHRLGDHARGRRRASARTPTCTGASWPTSTPASSRARSRAARASSPTRARARRAPRAPARRWRGWSRRPTRWRSSWRCGGAAAVRRRVRPRRAAADLHGRRARAAQRRRPTSTTRTGATTTAGCTARRWTGRPPRAATTRRRSRAGCGPGLRRLIAARRGDARDPRPGRRPSRSGPATTTSSASAASRRASALLVVANFTADPQAMSLDVARSRGFALTERGRRARRPPDRGLPRLRRPRALPAPLVLRLSAEVGQHGEDAAVAVLALGDVELAQHMAHVGLDRALADAQPLGDRRCWSAPRPSARGSPARARRARPSGRRRPPRRDAGAPTTSGSSAEPPRATRSAAARNSARRARGP